MGWLYITGDIDKANAYIDGIYREAVDRNNYLGFCDRCYGYMSFVEHRGTTVERRVVWKIQLKCDDCGSEKEQELCVPLEIDGKFCNMLYDWDDFLDDHVRKHRIIELNGGNRRHS